MFLLKRILFLQFNDMFQIESNEEEEESDPWSGLSYTVDLETGKSHLILVEGYGMDVLLNFDWSDIMASWQ